jgi:hypothetical protein
MRNENVNKPQNQQSCQNAVMQSALLLKIKIALRNKVGKYYKHFDFYFKDGSFCFKEKMQSEFMESVMVKGAFDDENDFNECIDQTYWRLKYSFEKIDLEEKFKLINRRLKATQERKLRNRIMRNLR